MAIDKIQSESINLADTFAFTGTVTGAGGNNQPYFAATMSGNQSLSQNSWTKVTFNTETFDQGGNYDHSSNYRFTPGVAGKYYIYSDVSVDAIPIASQVFGPTIPSADKPLVTCQFLTDASVPLPNIPSAVKPKNCCSTFTSSPRLPFFKTI
mgnify:CR=1 FL=1